MDRIDEIIEMFEKVQCPEDWKKCPLYAAGNDCDNYCPFVEAADMLKDHRKNQEKMFVKVNQALYTCVEIKKEGDAYEPKFEGKDLLRSELPSAGRRTDDDERN